MEICSLRPKTKNERQKKSPTEDDDYEDEVMKKSRMKRIKKKQYTRDCYPIMKMISLFTHPCHSKTILSFIFGTQNETFFFRRRNILFSMQLQ